MDNINIPRSQFVANLFHYFYASAKAALLPFLTLFFRQLGLSATQVGIIIAIKSVLAVMFASVWTSCATSCQKRRPVLMMSIFSSMVMCLLLSVVPPSVDINVQDFCMPVINTSSSNMAAAVEPGKSTPLASTNIMLHTSTSLPVIANNTPAANRMGNKSTLSVLLSTPKVASILPTKEASILPTKEASILPTKEASTLPTKEASILPAKEASILHTKATTTTTENPSITSKSVKPQVTTQLRKSSTITKIPTSEIKKTTTTTTLQPKVTTTVSKLTNRTKSMMEQVVTTPSREGKSNNPPATKLWDSLSEDDQDIFKKLGYTEDQINAMTESQLEDLITDILEKMQNEDKESKKNKEKSRAKRDIFSSSLKNLNHQLSKFQESLAATKNTAFILVLSIVIIGEVFSACTEKLADRIWFDFLDGLDVIEKYGPHRAWYALGFILVPVLVTAAVDKTPCILPHNIHHFNIHFYTYAGLMGIAFVFAFIYPILDAGKKVQRKSKVLRGMKILFSDAHGFSYIFSVFLLGLLTASIDNFLFWEVQDLGSTEVIMGGAITIAALSEVFMMVLMKWFLKKISYVGAIIMSLLLMSVRLIAYSFLWSPYVILPLAVFHALTHTLLLGAVENYPDFKVNPYIMDRSARSVLHAIYLAVGYSTGSALSGFLYDLIELKTVYQGGAIMSTVWCVLFALIHRCSKHKPKVRYARLLQAEADQMSDEAESVDDDWLEVALKHEK